MNSFASVLAVVCLSFASVSEAQDSTNPVDDAASKKPIYSPYVGRDFPVNVYWGDTHLHTSLSFDAYGDGNTTKGPDYAYRFAKGKQVEGHDGVPVRISRPLDFLVIADHGEYMCVVQGVTDGNKALLATQDGMRWSDMASKGEAGLLEVFGEMVNDGATATSRNLNEDFTRSVWQDVFADRS